MFVQINVASDEPYSREPQKEHFFSPSEGAFYNSKVSEIFLNKTWEFQLLVNGKYDLEKDVARQGAEVCIYILLLLLYYVVYWANN